MPKNQFLEPRQRARTQAADRARGDLERPDTPIIDPELSMHGAIGKAQRLNRALRAFDQRRLMTRRHIDRLFKERPFQRIGLLKHRHTRNRPRAPSTANSRPGMYSST
jgi:hypothetical protein